MSSDTPRTEDAWRDPVNSITRYEVSRQLERELSAARKEIERLTDLNNSFQGTERHWRERAKRAEAERDALKLKLGNWEPYLWPGDFVKCSCAFTMKDGKMALIPESECGLHEQIRKQLAALRERCAKCNWPITMEASNGCPALEEK